ncbi:MAG: hypothetical protein ABFS28_03830 [Bacteroidota bacterium]
MTSLIGTAIMIIRATKKLLNSSGIKPVKNLNESDVVLPGEWHAGLVSTGRVPEKEGCV